MACQPRQVAHQILQVLIVCRQKLPREGLRLLVEQAEDVTVQCDMLTTEDTDWADRQETVRR